jgi:serine/threonine-protein kinase
MTEGTSSGTTNSPRRRTDPLDGTPYRGLGPLGFGGMGEVLEAEHRALKKVVVVKLLREELASDARFVDRVRLEAQALAALSHPNIVSVTDYGATPNGRPYIVMERLRGRTVRQVLKDDGVLPVARAIEIVRQVLDGLGAAHRAGIVHRDIKTDNIFVCDPIGHAPAVVKLLDFGIVKLLSGEGIPASIAGPMCPTEKGLVVGTPRWLAPEQVKFQRVDARTDIFGAGLTLYVALAGRAPFAHVKGQIELLHAQLNEDPAPPSRYAPQPIPPELDAAVLRAIARNPADRYQTVEVFARELVLIATTLAATPLRVRTPVAAPSSGEPGPRAFASAEEAAEAPTAVSAPVVAPVPAPPPNTAATSPFDDAGETLRDAVPASGEPPAPSGAAVASGDPTRMALTERTPVQRPHRTRDVVLAIVSCTVFFSVVIAALFRYLGVR